MLRVIGFAACAATGLMWAGMHAASIAQEKKSDRPAGPNAPKVLPGKEVTLVQRPGEVKGATYHAYKYQWVSYLTNGRVVSGPERFGIVVAPKQPQENLTNFMSKNLPQHKEDLPEFVIQANFTAHTVVVFSHLTPVEKQVYEGMKLSGCLSVEILE